MRLQSSDDVPFAVVVVRKVQLTVSFQTIHEGKNADNPYTCWLCLEKNIHKSYQKRTLLESHIKSVHKLPRNQIDFSKIPDHSALENLGDASENGDNGSSTRSQQVKRLRLDGDEQFTCAKCNFACSERDAFQTHISKHKSMEEDALQCMECGMSFMTQPSLKRHLFVVHKIRDLQRYQAESGVNLEQQAAAATAHAAWSPLTRQARPRRTSATLHNGYTDSEGTELDPDANELECTVCYKECDNEASLRKHMRMHGMAFIRSRRSDT